MTNSHGNRRTKARIVAALKHGPMTVREIADWMQQYKNGSHTMQIANLMRFIPEVEKVFERRGYITVYALKVDPQDREITK